MNEIINNLLIVKHKNSFETKETYTLVVRTRVESIWLFSSKTSHNCTKECLTNENRNKEK